MQKDKKRNSRRPWVQKRWIAFLLFLAGVLWFAFCLPSPLFDVPYSRVLEDRNGILLGARVATDGQWRFPRPDSLPPSYVQALIAFEDKRFFSHPGVDPLALARAFQQNLRAGRIVSGGSTISMQVIRMARGNRSRNLWNKFLETWMAVRLEMALSKKEILQIYAAHAPFGGNVVGVETAAWRYFGKPLHQISRSQAALLAVLPNSPALIHPGRNREALLEKRNRLLRRIGANDGMDSLSVELMLAEPLPEEPLPLPDLAPHFLEFVLPHRAGGKYPATLDASLQERLTRIANHHHRNLSQNQIHNLAILVLDLESREVVSYVGNAPQAGAEHEGYVDLIQAARSTGSILKPFLYALALQDGEILPQSLLTDIPTLIHGFRPENYSGDFSGAVPAHMALARSLNVPFVRLLQSYGVPKFYHHLQKLGFQTIQAGPEHYGLSLILGGAEASLWDLTRAYSGMASTLLDFHDQNGRYSAESWSIARTRIPEREESGTQPLQVEPTHLDAGAIWSTFEALRQLERPAGMGNWRRFASSFPLAWKTGTSYGFRDAWAVGISPGYAIGVWVGNADGEGRPGLIGVQAAAPILFDVGRELSPKDEWFRAPLDKMISLDVCPKSGMRAGPNCPAESRRVPQAGERAPVCTFHRKVFLAPDLEKQVNRNCESFSEARTSVFFVLPPAEESYYRNLHPDYRSLPPFAEDCLPEEAENPMALLYPNPRSRILVPIDLAGKRSKTVFQAAHRLDGCAIHWHLDKRYVGTTQDFHEIALDPEAGWHQLTLVDSLGNRIEREFEIVERQK
jgi:penicillin-binding protein 1C